MNFIIIMLLIITFSLIFYSLLELLISRQRDIFRLKKYIEYKDNDRDNERSKPKLKNIISYLSQTIKMIKLLDSYREKIQTELIRAYIPLKSEEFIFLRSFFVIFIVFLCLITKKNLISTMLLAGVIWITPQMYLKTRIHSRIKQFNNSLGDAITLISNSLKAGNSFFQSIDVVSKDMMGVVAQEFSILKKEINLGYTTEEALDNLLKRVKSDDLELVITAVLIQRQVGGNLAEILDNISSTIRERIKIKGEIKTITAQGRMSGLIISILPPALGVILYFINPDHIKLLFTNNLGIVMLVLSIIMELLGIYFIKRIVSIEI